MLRKSRARHAAPTTAGRIAGRAAFGVVGAPLAMLAATGPAGAAELPSADDVPTLDPSAFSAPSFDTLPSLGATDLVGFLPAGAPALPDVAGATDLVSLQVLPTTVVPDYSSADDADATDATGTDDATGDDTYADDTATDAGDGDTA